MRRNILISILFSTLMFFIVLGMRNPYLNNNHGPKQRPRANVVKIVKMAGEIITDQLSIQGTVISLPEPPVAGTTAYLPLIKSATVVLHYSQSGARAPPRFSPFSA